MTKAKPKAKPPRKRAAPKKPRGRPSKFTPALAAEICARLGKGEPLTIICRDEHMPSDGTVRAWQGADANFSDDIACARARGFDAIALEALAIADATLHDTIEVGSGDNTREAANTEWISRSKLRVETRLKLLAKWDPKRYGDKQQVEHSGSMTLEQLVKASMAPPDAGSD
jgi:hypothetical protein